MPEAVLRCSVCGGVTAPDPMLTAFDMRYRTGYCGWCRERRVLTLAATMEEATRGYRQTLEARREALVERRRMMRKDE